MFYINKDQELTIELLNKMISKFNTDIKPTMEKYKKYYDGKHKILDKSYSDPTKPCSKVITNYCKNIADSYCGYLASPGFISYSSNEDITEVMDILRYNDYQAEDADLLLSALVHGSAAELMYTDMLGKVRFKLINPLSCFGIYDNSLTNDLLYFVRMYEADDWDNTDLYNVDVYGDWTVKHYTMSGTNGFLTYVSEEYHYFNQCPANIISLPDNKSIYDCVMSLQDASNELLSSEIDDYSAFCDAYLSLTGLDAEEDDIVKMKENRVLLLPEGAAASWLTKNASDAQVENMLKRIHDSIYRIAACPDFSSESFVGGVSSGIAIRYRLTGMETRAAKICAEFKKALQRRVEIISGIASLKLGEEVFRDIKIEFKRNIPEDITATINMINTLKGTVSDATLLGQLDFIPDVNAELEALEEQKKANMEAFGFPLTNTSGSEEEETEEE
jgi:SPP1 family phage portal protein